MFATFRTGRLSSKSVVSSASFSYLDNAPAAWCFTSAPWTTSKSNSDTRSRSLASHPATPDKLSMILVESSSERIVNCILSDYGRSSKQLRQSRSILVTSYLIFFQRLWVSGTSTHLAMSIYQVVPAEMQIRLDRRRHLHPVASVTLRIVMPMSEKYSPYSGGSSSHLISLRAVQSWVAGLFVVHHLT